MKKKAKGQRVLVVDDQPEIRRLVRAYLETMHRCEVEEAGNGIEAIKRLIGAPFDLLITDLIMPEMNGLELVSYLRKEPRLRLLPVVMLTAQDEETDRRKAMAFGVSDYLVKPFAPLSMGPVVEKHLKGA